MMLSLRHHKKTKHSVPALLNRHQFPRPLKQVVDRGHAVADVAKRLDITTHSLYAWIKKYGPDKQQHNDLADAQAEIKRLQKELNRATEERDILKNRGVLRKAVRLRYGFIKEHCDSWPVRWLCNMLDVHPSGYYSWSKASLSKRDKTNGWLTGLIKQFWLESGCVYGYRKIHSDLRDLGESCGSH